MLRLRLRLVLLVRLLGDLLLAFVSLLGLLGLFVLLIKFINILFDNSATWS